MLIFCCLFYGCFTGFSSSVKCKSHSLRANTTGFLFNLTNKLGGSFLICISLYRTLASVFSGVFPDVLNNS